MIVKILKVTVFKTGKDGQPMEGEYGQYWRVSIKAEGAGQKWTKDDYLTCMCKPFGDASTLKVGEEVDIMVSQRGSYWNFKLPQADHILQSNAPQGTNTSADAARIIIKRFDEIDAKLNDIVDLLTPELK